MASPPALCRGMESGDHGRLTSRPIAHRKAASSRAIAATTTYQGAKAAAAIAKAGTWKIEIVKRNERHRFVILPKTLDR